MQDETDLTSTYFIEDVIIIVLHISTVYGTERAKPKNILNKEIVIPDGSLQWVREI